jgi:hypothetical protein
VKRNDPDRGLRILIHVFALGIWGLGMLIAAYLGAWGAFLDDMLIGHLLEPTKQVGIAQILSPILALGFFGMLFFGSLLPAKLAGCVYVGAGIVALAMWDLPIFFLPLLLMLCGVILAVRIRDPRGGAVTDMPPDAGELK